MSGRRSLVLAAISVSVAATGALAFHGAAWVLHGTASLHGIEYEAVIRFSGAFGLGGETYTIEIMDPETGLLIHKNSFSGTAEFDVVVDGCIETKTMHAESTVPLVFELDSTKVTNLCTGEVLEQHPEGHYLIFEFRSDEAPHDFDA